MSLKRRGFCVFASKAAPCAKLACRCCRSGNANSSCSSGQSPAPTCAQRERRARAVHKREQLVCELRGDPLPALRSNDDDALPDFWASYAKALPHSALGLPQKAAYEALLKAVRTGRPSDFALVPMGTPVGGAKLANPQAAFAFEMVGGDPWDFALPPPPSATSAESAAELVELYAMLLLRDVPFDEYASNASVSMTTVLSGMNALADFTGPRQAGAVTRQTLFRGQSAGDLVGNYVSQFLLLPVPNGSQLVQQKYFTRAVGQDFMVTRPEVIERQRGVPPGTFPLQPARYIATGRDLAEFVHVDHPYQAFLQAALILNGLKVPANPGSPYNSISNQGAFVTFGIADIVTFVGEVARLALKAAWVEKWVRHRRLRPEVLALRVDTNRTGETNFAIDSQALGNAISQRVLSTYGNVLLRQTYPEGSPTHPAYPAGHAAIAGACVTALKAFFNGAAALPASATVRVKPNTNADELESLNISLNVNDELNKLANNIAIGRNISGVHYRSDGDQGVLLGEQVALRALRDLKSLCNEPVGVWSIRAFDGQTVHI